MDRINERKDQKRRKEMEQRQIERNQWKEHSELYDSDDSELYDSEYEEDDDDVDRENIYQ